MMKEAYIDLVLVKQIASDVLYLFQAPAWSHLKKGDRIYVDTRYGEAEGKVINSQTVSKDSSEFVFAVDCCKAKLPLRKVIAKFETTTLVYNDDEESEEKANAE